ncbi:uncharacterized protein LOC143285092 [Babylonia areolata]|uniref:uncharacterized protein LOC143285092 n=1 Tax=Babylonia areolata TaxID=304850 RepID=UPI003FD427EA
MSLKAFPMALVLDDPHISSRIYQKNMSEKMHNPSNIDLLLECEDDQSYALPQNNGVGNGLQLHTSNNVSMRISFSSCGAESLSCHYCQCNFLSETHLMDHMQKFHNDNESGEEDADDDLIDDLFQVSNEDNVTDNGDGYESADVKIQKANTGDKTMIVKTDTVAPDYVKTAMLTPINGVVTPPFPCYTNGANHSPPQAPPVSTSTLPENGAPEPKNLKRKFTASEAASNPRLTLTIKKSKSSYEIQRDEDASVPASPDLQVHEENGDVQSDSANETIDVESSSPHSSPGSEKNDIQSVISGRKNGLVKFFCGQCEKGYVSKYALKRHLATHSDERPFVCNFPGCKGAFKLKSRLTDHIRYVHKRKTPRTVNRSKSVPDVSNSSLAQVLINTSPLSGKSSAFSGKSSAVSGKPSAKTKIFKCPVENCNREFRDSYNRDSHMCLHTGYMPYKCSQCSYSTIQKTSMDWHMQTKHPQS